GQLAPPADAPSELMLVRKAATNIKRDAFIAEDSEEASAQCKPKDFCVASDDRGRNDTRGVQNRVATVPGSAVDAASEMGRREALADPLPAAVLECAFKTPVGRTVLRRAGSRAQPCAGTGFAQRSQSPSYLFLFMAETGAGGPKFEIRTPNSEIRGRESGSGARSDGNV